MTITRKQSAAIHALSSRLGLDDDTRRALIAAEADGKRSTKELTREEAARIIDRLKGLSTGLGPYAAKLRALWIAAYDLGIAREHDDRALIAFVRRQTGIDHPRWLRDPARARAVIEALKDWLTRAAGVAWPASAEPATLKHAVLCAQWRLLSALGAIPADAELEAFAFGLTGRSGWCEFGRDDYTAVQQALGRKLRAALHGVGRDGKL
jgi:hypothetical protein